MDAIYSYYCSYYRRKKHVCCEFGKTHGEPIRAILKAGLSVKGMSRSEVALKMKMQQFGHIGKHVVLVKRGAIRELPGSESYVASWANPALNTYVPTKGARDVVGSLSTTSLLLSRRLLSHDPFFCATVATLY
jgi:hypothetical protein